MILSYRKRESSPLEVADSFEVVSKSSTRSTERMEKKSRSEEGIEKKSRPFGGFWSNFFRSSPSNQEKEKRRNLKIELEIEPAVPVGGSIRSIPSVSSLLSLDSMNTIQSTHSFSFISPKSYGVRRERRRGRRIPVEVDEDNNFRYKPQTKGDHKSQENNGKEETISRIGGRFGLKSKYNLQSCESLAIACCSEPGQNKVDLPGQSRRPGGHSSSAVVPPSPYNPRRHRHRLYSNHSVKKVAQSDEKHADSVHIQVLENIEKTHQSSEKVEHLGKVQENLEKHPHLGKVYQNSEKVPHLDIVLQNSEKLPHLDKAHQNSEKLPHLDKAHQNLGKLPHLDKVDQNSEKVPVNLKKVQNPEKVYQTKLQQDPEVHHEKVGPVHQLHKQNLANSASSAPFILEDPNVSAVLKKRKAPPPPPLKSKFEVRTLGTPRRPLDARNPEGDPLSSGCDYLQRHRRCQSDTSACERFKPRAHVAGKRRAPIPPADLPPLAQTSKSLENAPGPLTQNEGKMPGKKKVPVLDFPPSGQGHRLMSEQKPIPRPWYKRNSSKSPTKPVQRPIINLPNFSNLDREAAQIIEENNRRSAEITYNQTAKELITMFNSTFTKVSENETVGAAGSKVIIPEESATTAKSQTRIIADVVRNSKTGSTPEVEEKKKLAIVQPQKSVLSTPLKENLQNTSANALPPTNPVLRNNATSVARMRDNPTTIPSINSVTIPEQWTCPRCTLNNSAWRAFCDVCFFRKDSDFRAVSQPSQISLALPTGEAIRNGGGNTQEDPAVPSSHNPGASSNPTQLRTRSSSVQPLEQEPMRSVPSGNDGCAGRSIAQKETKASGMRGSVNLPEKPKSQNSKSEFPPCENFLSELPAKENLQKEKMLGLKLLDEQSCDTELDIAALREARVAFFTKSGASKPNNFNPPTETDFKELNFPLNCSSDFDVASSSPDAGNEDLEVVDFLLKLHQETQCKGFGRTGSWKSLKFRPIHEVILENPQSINFEKVYKDLRKLPSGVENPRTEPTNTFMQDNIQLAIRKQLDLYKGIMEDEESTDCGANVLEAYRKQGAIPKHLVQSTFTGHSEKKSRATKDHAQIASDLLRKVDWAITHGEFRLAAKLAYELATQKIEPSKNVPRVEEPITIRVYVEDRMMQQGPFAISVTESMSVGRLKAKIETDWGIPANFQKWILGKKMAEDDDDILLSYKIQNESLAFLYLVTPEVGLGCIREQVAGNSKSNSTKQRQPIVAPKKIQNKVEHDSDPAPASPVAQGNNQLNTSSDPEDSEQRNHDHSHLLQNISKSSSDESNLTQAAVLKSQNVTAPIQNIENLELNLARTLENHAQIFKNHDKNFENLTENHNNESNMPKSLAVNNSTQVQPINSDRIPTNRGTTQKDIGTSASASPQQNINPLEPVTNFKTVKPTAPASNSEAQSSSSKPTAPISNFNADSTPQKPTAPISNFNAESTPRKPTAPISNFNAESTPRKPTAPISNFNAESTPRKPTAPISNFNAESTSRKLTAPISNFNAESTPRKPTGPISNFNAESTPRNPTAPISNFNVESTSPKPTAPTSNFKAESTPPKPTVEILTYEAESLSSKPTAPISNLKTESVSSKLETEIRYPLPVPPSSSFKAESLFSNPSASMNLQDLATASPTLDSSAKVPRKYSLPSNLAPKNVEHTVFRVEVLPKLESKFLNSEQSEQKPLNSNFSCSVLFARRSSFETDSKIPRNQKPVAQVPFTRRLSGSLTKQIQMFEALNSPPPPTKSTHAQAQTSTSTHVPPQTSKTSHVELNSTSKVNSSQDFVTENYQKLIELEKADLIRSEGVIDCPICLSPVDAGKGIVLRECLHSFCAECLAGAIEYADDAQVKCPFRDSNYACDAIIQEREIKALVPIEIFHRLLAKSVKLAECKMSNTFHCKTNDCPGWCVFEDTVNIFHCPVCSKSNCLNCRAIHDKLDCQQYQRQLAIASETDEDAKRSRIMLEKMIERGEALDCPACHVVLLKKWGCDWVRCSYCKTEICWVTKSFRWGQNGKGDTTGGCKCGVNGIKCHPKCTYCH